MSTVAEDIPQEIHRQYWGRRDAEAYKSDWDGRVQYWRDTHQRWSKLMAMYRGEWHIVFPGEKRIRERPKVPNIIRLASEDRAAQAASVPMTFRKEPPNKESVKHAEKLERIAHYYAQANRVDLLLPRLFGDLNLFGVNFKVVLPDVDAGHPRIFRYDPMGAYPDSRYSPDRPLGNIIFAYHESLASLARRYPNQKRQLLLDESDARAREIHWRLPGTMVLVLDYFDSSEIIRVALLPTRDGKSTGVILGERIENKLSSPPVVVAALPTRDDMFRGAYDDIPGILNAENRIFNLLIDGAEDWIASPLVYYDIVNPKDWGTGNTLQAKSKDAFMHRMPPTTANPQVFAALAQMRGNARAGANYPEVRSGEMASAIPTAAGANALMSSLNTHIAQDRMIEARSWEEVIALCFQTDEAWLDFEKTMRGTARSERFSESYRPGFHINGDHMIEADFGGAGGSSQFEMEIRLARQHELGWVSARTARMHSSFVRDIIKEENQLVREAILSAGLQFIQAAASQAQFAPAAALLEALEDEEDLMKVLLSFGDIQLGLPPQGSQGAQGAQGAGGQGAASPTGLEEFERMASMMRGGTPPPQLNVPGIGAAPLPPLQEAVLG